MKTSETCEQRDNIQFENIYLSHFSKMKYFAREYVISDEEAENIVQDVFMELWEKREVLSLQINLIAYLFTAIRNRCLNHLRHQTIVRDAASRILEEYDITLRINLNSLEAFDQNLFSEQDIEKIISKALDALPERCRKIFIMNKFDGKKQKQIAEELDISLSTVEKQMIMANKLLRAELKDFLPLFLFLLYL